MKNVSNYSKYALTKFEPEAPLFVMTKQCFDLVLVSKIDRTWG
jgi:hypothetical protein